MPEPTFRNVAIDNLAFDPENPRLPEHVDPTSRLEVLAFMLEDAGLIDLMGSIAKQGFFPGEPLLIAPDTEGQLIVVEGNRRFASCLLLLDPDSAPRRRRSVTDLAAAASAAGHDLVNLPCLVFERREDILAHLGYRHVTGIKEWDPLAKARFLRQRFEFEQGSYDNRFKSLARSIGSRSDYVGKLLTAYELYRVMEASNFFDIPGVNADSIEFSLISSMIAYSAIWHYLGLQSSQDLDLANLDRDHLAFLTKFVFERANGRTALGESRNLSTLADVLDSPRAQQSLETGSALAVASHLTEVGAQSFRSWVAAAKEYVELATDQLREVVLTTEDVDRLSELGTAVSSLETAARELVAEAAGT